MAVLTKSMKQVIDLAHKQAFSDRMNRRVSLCDCGSGDISLCNISHRYHCNECGNWPPAHWNKPDYAMEQWNDWVKSTS